MVQFKINPKIMLLSSICLGILVAIPKIIDQHTDPLIIMADSTITTVFALTIWYINLYLFRQAQVKNKYVSYKFPKLIQGLLYAMILMFILTICQLYFIPHTNFGPMMLMLQVRAVFIYFIFYMFIQLLYQNSINQNINIELERSKANQIWEQYELLKQQLNPHFLFNSLNTLKYMVESHDLKSVDFILKLSDFYRFTLKNRQLNLISLKEEIQLLHTYNYLLKTRFEQGLHIEIQLSPKSMMTVIPPFTLQLLVENAVKHNVISFEDPLHIKIYIDGQHISIENKINAKKNSEYSTGMGLDNINQRYQFLFNQKIFIDNLGHKFIVKLPLNYERINY